MASSGLENLKAAASQHATEIVDGFFDDATGTPIERLFFAALQSFVHLSGSEYTALFIPHDEEMERRLLDQRRLIDVPSLICRPQAQIGNWRVDFLIHAYDFARHGGPAGWKKLIVECDGHDFHERTKEQAAKDRSRDRDAQLADIAILRFTGSELHRDAWGCVRQVADWALKGFP